MTRQAYRLRMETSRKAAKAKKEVEKKRKRSTILNREFDEIDVISNSEIDHSQHFRHTSLAPIGGVFVRVNKALEAVSKMMVITIL